MKEHIPVLLNEAIDFLSLKEGGCYLDATIGFGGHSLRILEKIGEAGILIGIDADPESISETKNKISKFKNQFKLICGNFADLKESLKLSKCRLFDGLLYDLGTNYYQITSSDRGFSFRQDSDLDMRLNQSNPTTARDIVNKYSEKQLEQIFRENDERSARSIARAIVWARNKNKILRTEELVSIIKKSKKGSWGKIHPATKVFQALRIEVNNELDNLKKSLSQISEVVKRGGRVVVISFHSGEDRIVKNFFRDLAKEGRAIILTKKPVIPSIEEIKENPLARSAKLRAIEIV